MKKFKAGLIIAIGLAFIAVLCIGITGCGLLNLDGKIAGAVPASAVQAPLNKAYPGAGTAFVVLDSLAVQKFGKKTSSISFELESVTTNWFDSAGNSILPPPYRRVMTPNFKPRETEVVPTDVPASPLVVDQDLMAKIFSAISSGSTTNADGIDPAVLEAIKRDLQQFGAAE